MNLDLDDEAIAINLASIRATREAAAVHRHLSRVNAARFIDLQDADTRAGLQALKTAGLRPRHGDPRCADPGLTTITATQE